MTQTPATIRVWDPFVRIFHWSLVAAFVVAWLTRDDWKALHIAAGYTAAALVAARIVWGMAGSRYARFSQFVRPPSVILRYLAGIAAGREARHLGYNPAGGAMILALLLTLTALCFTGWLLTTDAFWGTETMAFIHELLTNLALVLIALHITGVLLSSFRHRENLVRAMLTGRKRPPESGDVIE